MTAVSWPDRGPFSRKGRARRPARTIAAGGALAIYAWAFVHTFDISASGRAAPVDPGLWPRMALLLLAGSLVAAGLAPRDGEVAPAEGGTERSARALSVIGAALAYVLAASYLGFLLATPPLLLIVCLACGLGGAVRLTLLSLGTTLVAVFVFAGVLGAPLPRGSLAAAYTFNSEAAYLASTIVPWR